MDLKTLEYFIAVAETGSISAAARKLNMSQPPLSMRIHGLEEELNVVLMERGPRHITLTDTGKLLYTRSKSLLNFAGVTKKEIEGLRLGRGGSLRLGIASSCGPILLSGPVSIFQRRFPAVRFELFERNTYELLDLLENSAIDLAIVRTPFGNPKTLNCLRLKSESLCAVSTKRFLPSNDGSGATEDSLSLSNLENKPLIIYRRWQAAISKILSQKKNHVFHFCVCDDARTCVSWAKAGLGVALVPESICKGQYSELFCTPLADSSLQTNICAVWRETGYIPAAATHFISVLQTSFNED